MSVRGYEPPDKFPNTGEPSSRTVLRSFVISRAFLPQAVSHGEQVSGSSGYRPWKTFSRSSPYAERLNSLATLSISELVRSNLNTRVSFGSVSVESMPLTLHND
jgi:hypothetical protein